MDGVSPDASGPLLHAAAMAFFPVVMGLSTTLCLRSRPSPFSVVALREYVDLTSWLDHLWLLLMLVWACFGVSRAESGTSLILAAAVALQALFLVSARFWFLSVTARDLASVADELAAAGELTTVSDDGVCVAGRRESESTRELAAVDLGVKIYSVAAIASVCSFATVTISAVGSVGGPSVLQCVLLAGLYVSLGVILADLSEDVWPGFTTDERVMRASRYYVLMFEQWKNVGVLAGFLTVFVAAPWVYLRGEAPLVVMSFPVWVAACLCFATFHNQVLHARGRATSTLPLPVWVNVYSFRNPLWAHFFAVIHFVMATALVSGLVALGI